VGVPDNQLRQQGWLADEQVYAKWPKRRGRSRLVIVGSACAPDAAVHTAKLLQALRVTPQARSVCPARQPDGKCLNDALCPPFTSHGASMCPSGLSIARGASGGCGGPAPSSSLSTNEWGVM
jgi:hypothetical protein